MAVLKENFFEDYQDEQRCIENEQNLLVDKISNTINSLNHVNVQIDNELDRHDVLLDDLNNRTFNTSIRLENISRGLDDLMKKAPDGCAPWLLIVILLLIIIVLFWSLLYI